MREQLKQRHLSHIRLRPTSMHESIAHNRAVSTHIARHSIQDPPQRCTWGRSSPTPLADVGAAEVPYPWLQARFRLCRVRRRRRGQLLVLLLIQTGVVVVVVVY